MTKDLDFLTNIIENISNLKSIKDGKNVIWESFYKNKGELPKNSGSGLKILMLNSPCFGFGDVVFCMKIATYLKEWYNADITIASTDVESFKKLGSDAHLINLGAKNKQIQCRRFKYLNISKNIHKYDLIFVAPMQSDYSPSLVDVKHLIPYANKFNTFFFSEYNSYDEDDIFDFPTGIGGDKFGLLLTPYNKIKRLNTLKNPYAFVYIAESVEDSDSCFLSFVEMIVKKYSKKYKHFDIVIPDSIAYFFKDYPEDIIDIVGRYYPNVLVVDKDAEYFVTENVNNKSLLTFRADILPVSYEKIKGLIQHSVNDVLLTGDQSITDALSCCSSKNIFYQTAGWKESFASELAKNLPNKYLANSKTSCGTLKAINYKSDYKNFVKEWDFRKLAKPKMDAIIRSAIYKRDYKNVIEDLEDMISSSKSVNTLKSKVLKYFKV